MKTDVSETVIHTLYVPSSSAAVISRIGAAEHFLIHVLNTLLARALSIYGPINVWSAKVACPYSSSHPSARSSGRYFLSTHRQTTSCRRHRQCTIR
jgi:hypothetical protein